MHERDDFNFDSNPALHKSMRLKYDKPEWRYYDKDKDNSHLNKDFEAKSESSSRKGVLLEYLRGKYIPWIVIFLFFFIHKNIYQ